MSGAGRFRLRDFIVPERLTIVPVEEPLSKQDIADLIKIADRTTNPQIRDLALQLATEALNPLMMVRPE